MKRLLRYLPPLIAVALIIVAAMALPGKTNAQDIREAAKSAEADRGAALEEARLAEAAIIADRDKLEAEVKRLEGRQAALEAELAALNVRRDDGQVQLTRLTEQWSGRELGFREISGNVRMAARDLESLLNASPLNAGAGWRLDTVSPLLDKGYFPDIDDIAGMVNVFFDEMDRGGQVSLREGRFIGRDGVEATGQVFQLGKFTSVYRTAEETGFLTWSPDGRQFFALADLPPRGVGRSLNNYLDGESDLVPVDMSGGSALRQLTNRAGISDQLKAGGPIVYPILLIAVFALGIVIYKVVFLQRMHGNTDRIMNEVNTLAAKGDWAACEKILGQHTGKKWSVVRVLKAGLAARGDDRETLESVLQESILRELPRVTRGIAVLAVLGAVAPLLGLLGTVTGMIDTFRIITLFGTGDPKLMSGGISEALVTTELGLAVAIPIMLLHTLLSRQADHVIGEMEEKAVHLTNIIQKRRILSGEEG